MRRRRIYPLFAQPVLCACVHNYKIVRLRSERLVRAELEAAGAWLTARSTLLGRMPPDSHAWIVTDEVPAFVRYVGPLHSMGPVWHLELASPRWPD